MPDPQALIVKNTDATIRIVRRPKRSAKRPEISAPLAQPSNIEATLNPVNTLSELKAVFRPSTVPFITPESKPNKNPPMVATSVIRITKPFLFLISVMGYLQYKQI
jgi:hypothetical protein